jgi:hypothetical protein
MSRGFRESGSVIAVSANADEPAARSGADGFGDPVIFGQRGGRTVLADSPDQVKCGTFTA